MGGEKVEQPDRRALSSDRHDCGFQAPEDPQIADMVAIKEEGAPWKLSEQQVCSKLWSVLWFVDLPWKSATKKSDGE